MVERGDEDRVGVSSNPHWGGRYSAFRNDGHNPAVGCEQLRYDKYGLRLASDVKLVSMRFLTR